MGERQGVLEYTTGADPERTRRRRRLVWRLFLVAALFVVGAVVVIAFVLSMLGLV